MIIIAILYTNALWVQCACRVFIFPSYFLVSTSFLWGSFSCFKRKNPSDFRVRWSLDKLPPLVCPGMSLLCPYSWNRLSVRTQFTMDSRCLAGCEAVSSRRFPLLLPWDRVCAQGLRIDVFVSSGSFAAMPSSLASCSAPLGALVVTLPRPLVHVLSRKLCKLGDSGARCRAPSPQSTRSGLSAIYLKSKPHELPHSRFRSTVTRVHLPHLPPPIPEANTTLIHVGSFPRPAHHIVSSHP